MDEMAPIVPVIQVEPAQPAEEDMPLRRRHSNVVSQQQQRRRSFVGKSLHRLSRRMSLRRNPLDQVDHPKGFDQELLGEQEPNAILRKIK